MFEVGVPWWALIFDHSFEKKRDKTRANRASQKDIRSGVPSLRARYGIRIHMKIQHDYSAMKPFGTIGFSNQRTNSSLLLVVSLLSFTAFGGGGINLS